MKSKKELFENIGEYLREKRVSRGLSQTQVAKALDVKPQFVSNWERGMSAPPMYMLRVVIRMYDISEREMKSFMLRQHEAYLDRQLFGRRRAS